MVVVARFETDEAAENALIGLGFPTEYVGCTDCHYLRVDGVRMVLELAEDEWVLTTDEELQVALDALTRVYPDLQWVTDSAVTYTLLGGSG